MIDRIEEVAARLKGVSHVTPVMTSRTLDRSAGARVWLKCEHFQRMGAFKFRGAYNAISTLGDAQRAAGVIAYSSGNHGQAVALVGRMLGIRTVIVMPKDAPAIKRQATEGYGAQVIGYDPMATSREDMIHRSGDVQGRRVLRRGRRSDTSAGLGGERDNKGL